MEGCLRRDLTGNATTTEKEREGRFGLCTFQNIQCIYQINDEDVEKVHIVGDKEPWPKADNLEDRLEGEYDGEHAIKRKDKGKVSIWHVVGRRVLYRDRHLELFEVLWLRGILAKHDHGVEQDAALDKPVTTRRRSTHDAG